MTAEDKPKLAKNSIAAVITQLTEDWLAAHTHEQSLHRALATIAGASSGRGAVLIALENLSSVGLLAEEYLLVNQGGLVVGRGPVDAEIRPLLHELSWTERGSFSFPAGSESVRLLKSVFGLDSIDSRDVIHGAPLFLDQQLKGLILISATAGSSLEGEEPDLARDLDLVANQLAVLLAYSGQRGASREWRPPRSELRGLFDVTVAISGVTDEEELLQRFYEQIRRFFGPDIFVVTLLSAKEDRFEIVIAEEDGIPIPVGERYIDLGGNHTISSWIINNRKRVFIHDLELETPPVPLRPLSRVRPRTWLGVPLVAYDRVLGVITCQSKRPNAFSWQHVRFLELLCDQAALAIGGGRLFQEEARRRRETEILHYLTSDLLDAEDEQEMLQIGIAAVQKYLPQASSISFSFYDEDQKWLEIRKVWVADSQFLTVEPLDRLPLKNLVISRQVIEEGRPVAVDDISKLVINEAETPRLKRVVERGLRSLLYIPMRIKGQTLGILHIGFWQVAQKISRAEVTVCESIANRVTVAIHAYQLQQAEREQLKIARSMQQMGAMLTVNLSLPEVFERLFDLLATAIKYDSATIQLYDEVEQRLYLAAQRGFDEDEDIDDRLASIGIKHLRLFAAGERVSLIPDTSANPDWVILDGVENKIQSWIGALLVNRGRLIGVLTIDSHQRYAFSARMKETALAFANQAVVAIEGARLYDLLNQRIMQLTILHQVALESTKTYRFEELIRQITQKISQTVYSHSFGILLPDEQGEYLVLGPAYHTSFGRVDIDRVPIDRSIVGHVFRSGTPQLVVDVMKSPHYFQGNPLTRSEVAVPIKLEDQVLGVINAEHPKVGHFSEDDVAFLMTLAGQIASSMSRIQVYEETQEFAETLTKEVQQRTRELREERDRLSAILQSAGEGILFTDPEGYIQYANDALLAQSGYKREELKGKRPNVLSSGLVSPVVYEDLWKAIKGGETWHGELINRNRDGTLYDIALTITPTFDEDGQLKGFVSVQSEITKLKELERLKTEFVTNVSHELRTPLTNIKTYITLLKKGRPEKRNRYFEILEKETERLTNLIQDLLDLSRLETGVTRIKLGIIDLGPVLRQVLAGFEQRHVLGDISLNYDFPESLPAVWADADQLQQVIINLLGNAFAYTPPGGQITCTAGHTENHVWIKIADTGYGIAPEEMQRLFDRFYRGRAAEQARAPGTGLGLAISKEIIDRHRGTIIVESEVDVGTTFTISLPIRTALD